MSPVCVHLVVRGGRRLPEEESLAVVELKGAPRSEEHDPSYKRPKPRILCPGGRRSVWPELCGGELLFIPLWSGHLTVRLYGAAGGLLKNVLLKNVLLKNVLRASGDSSIQRTLVSAHPRNPLSLQLCSGPGFDM